MVLGSKSLRKAKDKLLDSMSQTVTLKLVHGRDVYETTMPCFSSFGQLKVCFIIAAGRNLYYQMLL